MPRSSNAQISVSDTSQSDGCWHSRSENQMIIDFHHHYTPPELMRGSKDGSTVRLDEKGNPNYRFNASSPIFPRMCG